MSYGDSEASHDKSAAKAVVTLRGEDARELLSGYHLALAADPSVRKSFSQFALELLREAIHARAEKPRE